MLLGRQLSTLRVVLSMMATRYKNPFRTGTKVMSAHQTWFVRTICIFLSRYGKTGCWECGWLILGRLMIASKRILAIKRLTR